MTPLKTKIKLAIEEVKIGAIQSDAIEEHGTILSVGEWVDETVFSVGRTLYFKAWAIDVITDNGEKHYFISSDSDAICAIK